LCDAKRKMHQLTQPLTTSFPKFTKILTTKYPTARKTVPGKAVEDKNKQNPYACAMSGMLKEREEADAALDRTQKAGTIQWHSTDIQRARTKVENHTTERKSLVKLVMSPVKKWVTKLGEEHRESKQNNRQEMQNEMFHAKPGKMKKICNQDQGNKEKCKHRRDKIEWLETGGYKNTIARNYGT
jgi:hypothetical protein